MGHYRVVPVVRPNGSGGYGELVGWVTEQGIATAFLYASSEERKQFWESAVGQIMETPPEPVAIAHRTVEVAEQMSQLGVDTLPVTDYQNNLLGILSRSDLVQELVRPYRPPIIGGMATPIGVHLTTGGVSGGVGAQGLFLTGLGMFVASFGAALLTQPLVDRVILLPPEWQASAKLFLETVGQLVVFLGFIHFSPMAGYHAAEHQVVHALERGEPLQVPYVQKMPRVHPRCGTNIVAGGTLFWIGGTALQPWLGEFAFLLSGLLTLVCWRVWGEWLQQYVTTKPATDAQIEDGIRAANELLAQYNTWGFQPITPLQRLWNMGFLPIFVGFGVGYGTIYLLYCLFPQSLAWVNPLLQSLW
jgi:hypothetical protein